MSIDRTAAEGFAAGAGAYERARPGYPPEAVAWLLAGVEPARPRVVDLGAGTGKLTSVLAETRVRVVAIEPVREMRRRLAAALPSVRVLAGTAEAIPLAGGSADAVLAAQAFHWFDGPRALAEIRRVLRLGGRLGLMWNARDRRVDWVARMSAIVDAHGDAIRRHETEEWRKEFEAPNGFSPLEEAEFANPQEVDEERLLDRVSSTSFIAALPVGDRDAVLGSVRVLVRSHADTRDRATFVFPHRTRVYRCERL